MPAATLGNVITKFLFFVHPPIRPIQTLLVQEAQMSKTRMDQLGTE